MDREMPGPPQEAAMSGAKSPLHPAVLRPHTPLPLSPSGVLPAARPSQNAVLRRRGAESRLAGRVFERCDAFIQEACRGSSVPAAFLGALTANESGGDGAAVRFEPSVYRHLQAVAAGQQARYAGIGSETLSQELEALLHPKSGEFHALFLHSAFMQGQRGELAARADEALRELASSWGFTQIMGFHLIGRRGTVRDLAEPRFHYRLALELLAEFAACYQLDLGREFEELFRCWNTGRPDGKTADPAYVEHGLARMELYKAAEKAAAGGVSPSLQGGEQAAVALAQGKEGENHDQVSATTLFGIR